MARPNLRQLEPSHILAPQTRQDALSSGGSFRAQGDHGIHVAGTPRRKVARAEGN